MANRKPWDLKGFIIAYNLALTLLSVYMVIEVSQFMGSKKYWKSGKKTLAQLETQEWFNDSLV